MKPVARSILAITILISLSLITGGQIALTSGAANSEKKSIIDESFNVGKHLNVKDQRSRVPGGKEDTDKPSGVAQVLIDAIDLLVKFIGAIALIVFIIGALLTIVSEGKEDRLEKGKSAMLYAIIGLIVAFFSFIIVTFVQSILF